MELCFNSNFLLISVDTMISLLRAFRGASILVVSSKTIVWNLSYYTVRFHTHWSVDSWISCEYLLYFSCIVFTVWMTSCYFQVNNILMYFVPRTLPLIRLTLEFSFPAPSNTTLLWVTCMVSVPFLPRLISASPFFAMTQQRMLNQAEFW